MPELFIVLAILAAGGYALYRLLVAQLHQAVAIRRYVTACDADRIDRAFVDAGTWMGWRVIRDEPPFIIAPRSRVPELICVQDDPVGGRRKIHVGVTPDTRDKIGHDSVLGGISGDLLAARGVRARLDRIETRLHDVDPKLRRLE